MHYGKDVCKQTCFKSGQIFDEKYELMLGASSFNILQELRNKAIVGFELHILLASKGASCPYISFSRIPLPVVGIAPTPIRVL